MVTSLLVPSGTYYAFSTFPLLFQNRLNRLIFRMVARLSFDTILINSKCYPEITRVVKIAQPDINVLSVFPTEIDSTSLFFITECIEEVLQIQFLPSMYVLVLHPRKSSSSLMDWLKRLPAGLIVLDLYEAILITGIPDWKNLGSFTYVFKTTL